MVEEARRRIHRLELFTSRSPRLFDIPHMAEGRLHPQDEPNGKGCGVPGQRMANGADQTRPHGAP